LYAQKYEPQSFRFCILFLFFNPTPTIVQLRTVCFLFSSGLFNPMMAMSGALHPLLLGSQLSLANPLLASWLAGHQGGATIANSQDPSPAGFSSALVSRYPKTTFLSFYYEKLQLKRKLKSKRYLSRPIYTDCTVRNILLWLGFIHVKSSSGM
jgi:hypothetical protein